MAESTGFGSSERWDVIVRTVQVFLGGIFSSIVILSLVLYCAICMKYRNVAGYFIIVFLSIGIIPLFFGDKIVQSRILFDIPFQVPAGLALSNIFVSRYGGLKAVAISACLISVSIHVMANLGSFA